MSTGSDQIFAVLMAFVAVHRLADHSNRVVIDSVYKVVAIAQQVVLMDKEE